MFFELGPKYQENSRTVEEWENVSQKTKEEEESARNNEGSSGAAAFAPTVDYGDCSLRTMVSVEPSNERTGWESTLTHKDKQQWLRNYDWTHLSTFTFGSMR